MTVQAFLLVREKKMFRNVLASCSGRKESRPRNLRAAYVWVFCSALYGKLVGRKTLTPFFPYVLKKAEHILCNIRKC